MLEVALAEVVPEAMVVLVLVMVVTSSRIGTFVDSGALQELKLDWTTYVVPASTVVKVEIELQLLLGAGVSDEESLSVKTVWPVEQTSHALALVVEVDIWVVVMVWVLDWVVVSVGWISTPLDCLIVVTKVWVVP